jgi:hypothetical protein
MNREMFENWILMHFVSEVQAFPKQRGWPQKVVFLLDNDSSHPKKRKSEEKNILSSDDGHTVENFCPSVTAITEHMDQ